MTAAKKTAVQAKSRGIISPSSAILLSHLVDVFPGGVYWKNTEGCYLGCNQIMLEMAGLPSITGKTDWDMPWAASAPRIHAIDLQVMREDKPQELEQTISIANGESIVLFTRKTPLHDESGKVIGVIGTSLNITKHKQVESKLRSSQEETLATLENIVANMPGHVYWKDKNGVYLGCNNRQARSLGFQYGYEVVGKTDFDLPWGENQAELFRNNDLHIMNTGQTEMIEENAQVDGKNAVVLSHKAPMRNKQGKIIGVLGISIDISEQKKIEAELSAEKNRAEAASFAKTEFLENMRHDIRTPLTGIVGFSEIIKREAENPKIQEYADNLVASSHALLDLMDSVLEAIHVSSGELPRLKKKFNLRKTIQKIMDLCKAKALTKHLEFNLSYDEHLPSYLVGDMVRLQRIILELVSNALNFTNNGFVRLSVQLAKKEHRELVIKLAVEDSGIGIPKEKQQEIFLQFKRLTPSYKGIYNGIGLGLSVVKQFVEDLEGEIYVQSKLNKGTVFTCLLPFHEALLADDTGVEIEKEEERASLLDVQPMVSAMPTDEDSNINTYQILLVEDNPVAQIIAQNYLQQLGCSVTLANDGKTALSLCEKNSYNLVLMDVGLPDMDGYFVARQIRNLMTNRNPNLPIIALTAHVGEENKQRCIDSGMNVVMNKPLTYQNCSDLLDSFLNKKVNHSTSRLPQIDKTKEDDLTSYPLLDIEEGVKITGSLQHLQQMLVFLLEQSLPEDLAGLRQAFDAQNWEQIPRMAHKLKAGLVYVGVVRLRVLCQLIEQYCHEGQHEKVIELVMQLNEVVQESEIAIRSWLKSSPASS